MQGNVLSGSWELAENYLSSVFSLCSVFLLLRCFYSFLPSSGDLDLLLDICIAVSGTTFLKENESLIGGNLVVLPSCFPELEFLVRTRKNSSKRKRVIQAQPNESSCSGSLPRRDCEEGMSLSKTLALVLPCSAGEGI